MGKKKATEAAEPWKERGIPRTFGEKAYRLQQLFTDWLDGNMDRLKFRDDGDWITTRMVELLLLEKAAECSSRTRVDSMRLVATDMMSKIVKDPTTLKEIEAKIDELFRDLEAYDEMGLNDPRYHAKVRELTDKLSGKNKPTE
ncbi:MAG: hypothetical protein HY282_06605 [Nitrospirae bacterium]|nr:hypothetical protein [Candidatus Manganitrophaceae bacterium]